MKKAKVKNRTLPIVAAVLTVAVIAAVLLWHPWTKKEKNPSAENTTKTVDFSGLVGKNINGFLITDAQNIGGVFWEDGQNGSVDAVMTLEIQNMTNQTLQYTALQLTCGGETYDFSFSTIPSQAKVLVQEQNKKVCQNPRGDWTGQLSDTVWFSTGPSMNERLFKVTGDEQTLTVTNLTTADITGQIRIAYKNWDGERYVGGITYSVTYTKGLPAGESRNFMTKKFHPEKSRVMFVDYVS